DVGEALQDHLADPLRADLGDPALLQRRLDVVDQRSELLGGQALGGGLLDRAGELPPVELLPGAVPLEHLDAGRLAPLERGEPCLAAVAGPAAPDGGTVLGLARVDHASIRIAAARATHRTQDMGRPPLNLVAVPRCSHDADERLCRESVFLPAALPGSAAVPRRRVNARCRARTAG